MVVHVPHPIIARDYCLAPAHGVDAPSGGMSDKYGRLLAQVAPFTADEEFLIRLGGRQGRSRPAAVRGDARDAWSVGGPSMVLAQDRITTRMPPMRRTILTVATLSAVVAFTSGCGALKRGPHYYEIGLEVTGKAGKITFSVPPNSPDEKAQPPTEVAGPTVPWKEVRVTVGGEVKLQVTPADGPVTCRILIEKKQVAKKEGPPGTELTCTATASSRQR